MNKYIKEAIMDFGKDVTRAATTPTKKTLFKVDMESEALSDKKREKFHSIVAKLLYISKRGTPDIQPICDHFPVHTSGPQYKGGLGKIATSPRIFAWNN
jgi:hypothetical protein